MREGWTYKRLGEVCESDLGKTLNSSKDTGELRPYLCAINILWDKIDFTTLKQTRFEESELERYTVRKGDLLICEGGDIGRAAIWDKDYSIQYQNALHRVRFTGNVAPRFCLYYFMHLKKSGILDGRYGKGITIKHLVKSSLMSIPIPVAPIEPQQSIVAELDKINELIGLKKSQLSDLDSLAQSIFYEMFGDPVENEKGWEVKKLGDIAKIGDGLHGTPQYDDDGKCFFINGNNLENGRIIITKETKKVNDQEKKKYYLTFNENTLFVSINGTIGKTAFYNKENIILGKSACYIILNNDINKHYIMNVIKSRYFLDYAWNEYTGTTIKNVSLKSMRHFPIPLPPLPLQQSFAARITAIEQQKQRIIASLKDLETLLASRMQYWFDG